MKKETLTNQILTHLLLGLYTAFTTLPHSENQQKMEFNFLFIEKQLLLHSFDQDSDLKQFSHIVFYFAKSNRGSPNFWDKIEKAFKNIIEKMKMEDISYLTSSFRTNLPLSPEFWMIFEKRILKILQDHDQNQVKFPENEVKNVVYILSYHQRGTSVLWKFLKNLVLNKEIDIKPENRLKMVNYMKSIQFVEDDFLLGFFESEDVITSNDFFKYSMSFISLFDHRTFDQTESKSRIQRIKDRILKIILDKYNQEENIMSLSVKHFTELCWIITKLEISEFTSIKDKIGRFFFDHVSQFESKFSSDNLAKLTWVVFTLKLQRKDPSIAEKLHSLVFKRLGTLNSSIISFLCLLFGNNKWGNFQIWQGLLSEIIAKYQNFNIQQLTHCIVSIGANFTQTEAMRDVAFELVARFVNDYYSKLSRGQCKELVGSLKKMSDIDSKFLHYYLRIKILHQEILEDECEIL